MGKSKSGKEEKTRGSHDLYKFDVVKGLLYRVYQNPSGSVVKQLVVPKKFRYKILKLGHDSAISGHLLTGKTKDRVSNSFFWPGVTGDIARFCRSCDLCLAAEKPSDWDRYTAPLLFVYREIPQASRF